MDIVRSKENVLGAHVMNENVLQDSSNQPSYRVMVRKGNNYVGDIDGDGRQDIWRGYFNPISRFGVGEFSFNEGPFGPFPRSFKSLQGNQRTYHTGDKVTVNSLGQVRTNQTIAEWDLTVSKGEFSTHPNQIFVSINFYTKPVSDGHGDRYNIDEIID